MGVLLTDGVIGEDGGIHRTPGAVEPEEPTTPEATPPADDGDAHVPSDYQPAARAKKPSRREQAIEESINARFKDYETRAEAERREYAARIEAADRRAAMLEGRLQEIGNRPAPAAAPTHAGPSPEQLDEEADKALEAQDLRTYRQKTQAAADIRGRRVAQEEVAAVRRDLEARIPQQMPPHVMALLGKHQSVALAGPRGERLVMLKLQELDFEGVPDGPEKLSKAFELADKVLERQTVSRQQQARGPAYSQDAAAALAAVPATRPAATGGGGGGNGAAPQLTDAEKRVANSGAFGPDRAKAEKDYERWKYPDRFIKR